MDAPKQDQRLQLVTSRQFIEAVDEWRRQQADLPSRSEAIRRLVQIGLDIEALKAEEKAGQ